MCDYLAISVSVWHFLIELALAAPKSGLPFLSKALDSHALDLVAISELHLVRKAVFAAPKRFLPFLSRAFDSQEDDAGFEVISGVDFVAGVDTDALAEAGFIGVVAAALGATGVVVVWANAALAQNRRANVSVENLFIISILKR